MEVTLPQDRGPPPHPHAWDEAYFVLEGDVRFTVDGQEFTASTATSCTRQAVWRTGSVACHRGLLVC